MCKKKKFFLDIYHLGIIKFGDFLLKSGLYSPIYIDFRPIASRPDILIKLSDLIIKEVFNYKFELICGVPYAALPIAIALSLKSKIPLIIKRKENKGYGTKKMIEGIYKKGQPCLIIEDVITSGESLLKTILDLEKEGLIINNIISILDREQGGTENIKKAGYNNINSLFKIKEILNILEKKKLLSYNKTKIIKILKKNTINLSYKRLSYEEKKDIMIHPIGKKLLNIVLKKKTNLIAAADLVDTEKILNFARLVGDNICCLKIHVDIINNFSYIFTKILKQISLEKEFLIIEDRKFCDINSTNILQINNGIYKIYKWADIITIHVIAGESSIKCLNIPKNIGLITISEMSSYDQLADENYIIKSINISLKNKIVIGTVAQRKVDNRLLLFIPGVNMYNKNDINYTHLKKAIKIKKGDFIIVGKSIYESKNPKKTSEEYKNMAWKEYEKDL